MAYQPRNLFDVSGSMSLYIRYLERELALVGTAVIGYRVGDVFEWDTPAGKARLRVEQILYQPEEDGVYE